MKKNKRCDVWRFLDSSLKSTLSLKSHIGHCCICTHMTFVLIQRECCIFLTSDSKKRKLQCWPIRKKKLLRISPDDKTSIVIVKRCAATPSRLINVPLVYDRGYRVAHKNLLRGKFIIYYICFLKLV